MDLLYFVYKMLGQREHKTKTATWKVAVLWRGDV